MAAIVTTARDFSSRSLRAYRVERASSAPVLLAEDGTPKTYVILGVQHHQGYTELVGWYRAGKEWRDETLETWEGDVTDAEALTTAEILPVPLTIR